MDIIVVESPAKAKTINRYLGDRYRVLASYGHVRDLPSKDGSVRPDEDFAMDWEIEDRAEKRLRELADAIRGADRLFLATDPDREGEAISWHVCEILKRRKVLDGIKVARVTFNEITKKAVADAMAHPRELDQALIEAYLARRALDYLVGFNLSPVLWRKLPGSRSAGRVQSVALRLVCEREAEIELFRPREFWTVTASLRTPSGGGFKARLTHLGGEKLDKFALADEAAARRAAAAVNAASLRVAAVDRSVVKRHPQPPFTTSTLQQEASRKLGFSASKTMRSAQRLYEGVELKGETVGLITYMRTDSVNMANEAVEAARALIRDSYDADYLPAAPRSYKNKSKTAQEAHEAIRPTDFKHSPESVARYLDESEARLYELIWKRALASQMESARLDRVVVDIASHADTFAPGPGAPSPASVGLRATGSVVAFPGFLKLYEEGLDDAAGSEDEGGAILPPMVIGDALAQDAVLPEQHFTQPPPRYSEASLVKKLEELGIGRPSTYASILDVLRDRKYVRMENRRFVPEDRGRLVTAFLAAFFGRYVEYNFTADLEDKLDEIANGGARWRDVLRAFWEAFSRAIEQTRDLTITQVVDTLDAELGPHFFPEGADGKNPRVCPACADGRLGLKLGRHGAFIGCSNYPNCSYTRPLAVPTLDGSGAEVALPRVLGVDPATGEPVSLRKGPFGLYVQLGEASEDRPKPKRASVAPKTDISTIDLDAALGLLALPREVGHHPSDGQPIIAGLGRFGPYLKYDDRYVSIPRDEDARTIGINRAVTLIDEARERERAATLRDVGAHPADGKPVTIIKGRFGPYLRHGRVAAPLPKGRAPESVTMDDAIALLAAKTPKKKGKGKAKRPAKAAKAGQAVAAKSGAKSGAMPDADTASPKTAKPKTRRTAGSAAKKPASAKKPTAAKAKAKAKTNSSRATPNSEPSAGARHPPAAGRG
ncbi:MAG: type I DNA topoisomerase, partial [Alphaproteobacteria bacterium]